MATRQTTPDRVRAFSDAVFAVLITVLVLELKPPNAHGFSALLPLWPTGLSYVVSYLFIAIVWVNHHHLFNYAEAATPRLVWSNFAHLFSVSLIPFTTEWIADSRLAAAPVALYAAVFVLVNITYLALCWEAVDRPAGETEHPQFLAGRRIDGKAEAVVRVALGAADFGRVAVEPHAALA